MNQEQYREQYRARYERARQVDLRAVLLDLGGQPDRHDRHKFRLEGHIISVHGLLFYDYLHSRGGKGAIDLVMHLRGIDAAEAVRYLDGGAFPTQTLAMGTPPPVPMRETAPFVPPERHEERWPAVRAYLTGRRQLPAPIVDGLHRLGAIYADDRRNAVFVRRDLEGAITGAALRSTRPGHAFKGLAPGTRREAGYFMYRAGAPAPDVPPRLVLVESPIDAISLHALRAQSGERGQALLLSTDGAGALPIGYINRALARGWRVQAAFDNDRAGELFWQQVRERYPAQSEPDQARPGVERLIPPQGKDWNDSLRYLRREPGAGPAQARLAQQDRGR